GARSPRPPPPSPSCSRGGWAAGSDRVPEGGSAGGAGGVRTGVLLVNLGTPDAPRPAEVRRYLREFLGDPRVLDGPALARFLVLHLAILPWRPRTAARAYAKIWTPAGSPLLVHGEALRAALARALRPRSHRARAPESAAAPGMRHARRSRGPAAAALAAADVARVLALPLFPQWSEAATASAEAKLREELARAEAPPVSVLPPFYAEPRFVAAVAAVARPHLAELRPDHVLFSYHGLPERQVRAADRSRRHC